ncbi:MAG: hypothetical protein IJT49_07840 [Clostridia bacterium]|nr:hypothetical protein [Clostridia bacterium]
MKKILENFKKMSLLYKIASIAFLAALVTLIFSTLFGYIGDIFFFGLFKAMFANVYGFFAVILYFIQSILQLLFVAALITALFSGNRKNVAFVLLCKAVLIAVNLFFVTPFMRILLVISYGFQASIIPGSTVYSGFISFILMIALIALSALLFNGLGKFTKPAAFITVGLFSVIFVTDIVRFITAIVDSVKDFIQGNVASGVFGLTANTTGQCVSIIMACGYIVLTLATIIVIKAKKTPAGS